MEIIFLALAAGRKGAGTGTMGRELTERADVALHSAVSYPDQALDISLCLMDKPPFVSPYPTPCPQAKLQQETSPLEPRRLEII